MSKRARRAYYLTCWRCGEPLNKYQKRWCSPLCRSVASYWKRALDRYWVTDWKRPLRDQATGDVA